MGEFATIMFFIIVWTLVGYLINAIYGLILSKSVKKYYDSQDEMMIDLMVRNYDKTGSVDVSELELIFDAFLWPVTIVKASIGQRRIINDLKERKINNE